MTSRRVNPSALVSVITLSYNYAHFLPHTINAILNQTHKNIQYIIIDDGSSDDSVKIARTYAQADARVEVIALTQNRGACAAYAEAYKHLRGEFVCSIDADDIPHPTMFQKQLDFFSNHPDHAVVSTYINVINAQGEIAPTPNLQQEWVNQRRDLDDLTNWASGNYIAHSATMIRRAAHDKVGVLDTDMVYAPDYEHFTRLVVNGEKIATLPEILLSYRVHNNNITHKDPQSTFVEFIYIYWKWIMPKLIQQRRFGQVAERLSQIVAHDQYAEMSFDNRMRLLSVIVHSPSRAHNFKEFKELIAASDIFSGSVLESTLAYSPANLELRSMLRTTSRMSSTIDKLAAQIEELRKNNARSAEISQYRKLLSRIKYVIWH